MNVADAVAARRSVRGFLPTPVDADRIAALARAAARAPSGGNLQPWHIDIVTGESLARIVAAVGAKIADGALEAADYAIYPPALDGAYRDRRFEVGMALYGAMGIARDDKTARQQEFRRNFEFFGAPAGLFCTVDRMMGPPQWSDLGMFLQSFMLLATDAGLATCAQECWAMYGPTVRGLLGTPPERLLFCGMAIGLEDTSAPANRLRTMRAPEGEWLTVRQ